MPSYLKIDLYMTKLWNRHFYTFMKNILLDLGFGHDTSHCDTCLCQVISKYIHKCQSYGPDMTIKVFLGKITFEGYV